MFVGNVFTDLKILIGIYFYDVSYRIPSKPKHSFLI